MTFVSVVILSSILEWPALNISTKMTEGPGDLSDFIAFRAVDIVLCMISSGGLSNVGASSNIPASQGDSILNKCCYEPAKQWVCLHQRKQWKHHLSLHISPQLRLGFHLSIWESLKSQISYHLCERCWASAPVNSSKKSRDSAVFNGSPLNYFPWKKPLLLYLLRIYLWN